MLGNELGDKSKMDSQKQLWFVYMLRCGDKSLYTGITTNVERRLRQHRGEIKGGARYTRSRTPLTLVWLEPATDRSEASRREMAIKALRAQDKEALIANYVSVEEIS